MKTTISTKVSSKLKNYKGKVRQSLTELFTHGTTCTGESGYRKSRAFKDIWTAETIKASHEIGLTVHSGNSFPRGGAGGEWVKLVEDGRKNKLAQECRKVFKRFLKIKKLRNEKTEKAIQEQSDIMQELTVAGFESRKAEIANELKKKYEKLQLSNKQANSAAWHIGLKFFGNQFKQTTLRTLIKSL
jgi:hypothetical protein